MPAVEVLRDSGVALGGRIGHRTSVISFSHGTSTFCFTERCLTAHHGERDIPSSRISRGSPWDNIL